VTLVERAGEELARQLNRRQTLKRVAVAVFGTVAAWTVEGFARNSALAQTCGYVTEGDCTCNPPYGAYCNRLDRSYCTGSACSGGCAYDETYRYAGACWCSATCQYDGGEVGYYQCCDCNCYGQQCACREFISTGFGAEPRPERPDDSPPQPPPGDGPPLPPPGDDGAPDRPPGVPECFPFCD
jgi:hypothetical protein